MTKEELLDLFRELAKSPYGKPYEELLMLSDEEREQVLAVCGHLRKETKE